MNNIFNFKRFVNYLGYDLHNAKNYYGLSMLVVGLLPLIVFAFSQILYWLVSKDTIDQDFGLAFRVMTLSIAVVIVMLTAPPKLYGRLTERRYGSDWLLIPASTFEKWLSMMIIILVVVPVVMVALLLVSDTLLALLFPARYGENVFSLLAGHNLFRLDAGEGVELNLVYPFWVSWITSGLSFLLGSVVFKRAKVAKTILVCMAIGVVCSAVIVPVFQSDNMVEWLENMDWINPYEVSRWFNNWINITFAVEFVLLAGGLFYRLKTIKH